MTTDLLPGVRSARPSRDVRCDSRRVMVIARRMALVRDVLQLTMIAAVDYFFVTVPTTHIPMLLRSQSLRIVAVFNIVVVLHVFFMRRFPVWKARRIASTWCPSERTRFRVD